MITWPQLHLPAQFLLLLGLNSTNVQPGSCHSHSCVSRWAQLHAQAANHLLPCRPSWHLAGVVAIISCGLVLLVYGETAFDLTGFVLVMSASMLSGLRWTITQVLLQGKPGASGHGASGGPIEILLHLTPGEHVTLLEPSCKGHGCQWLEFSEHSCSMLLSYSVD